MLDRIGFQSRDTALLGVLDYALEQPSSDASATEGGPNEKTYNGPDRAVIDSRNGSRPIKTLHVLPWTEAAPPNHLRTKIRKHARRRRIANLMAQRLSAQLNLLLPCRTFCIATVFACRHAPVLAPACLTGEELLNVRPMLNSCWQYFDFACCVLSHRWGCHFDAER